MMPNRWSKCSLLENNAGSAPQIPVRTEEKSEFTPWKAAFDGRSVYIPYKSELMELRDRGFGDLKGEKLILSPYESCYLVEKQKVRVFTYATSLGDYQSLMFYYPTAMDVDAAEYLDAGQKAAIREWMGDGIMRISIGLEDAEDLVADLDQALAR